MRRLLFHVRRTVRDLRRGGIRVLVRKVRRQRVLEAFVSRAH